MVTQSISSGTQNRNLSAALAYASKLGWRPIPLNGKIPLLKSWPENAPLEPEAIRQLWALWPSANIGIATGPASGLLVLDVDPRHGGLIALEELQAEHGQLPQTPTVKTGSGGLHHYFACPEPPVGNSAGRLGPGLDIRCTGGQVVAPPSIHPDTGQPYSWLGDCHPLTTPLAPTPSWILEALAEPQATAAPLQSWAEYLEPIAEGGRNAALARLVGHLLRRHVDAQLAQALAHSYNLSHLKPPLAADEADRTIDSIAAAELRRMGATNGI